MAEKRIMMQKYFVTISWLIAIETGNARSLMMIQKIDTTSCEYYISSPREKGFSCQPCLWKCRWVKDLKDKGGYEEKEPLSPQDHLNILMEEGGGAQVSPWPLWQKGERGRKFKEKIFENTGIESTQKIPWCCISREGLLCPQRANVFFSIAQHP